MSYKKGDFMVSQLEIQKYYKEIEDAPIHEEQIVLMIKGIKELYPVNNVYFFKYSPILYSSEGIIYLNEANELSYIKNVQDDLRSLPIILNTIKNRKAQYFPNITIFSHNQNIPDGPIADSMLVLPICQSSNVIGYTVSTKFKDKEITDDIISSLTLYGKNFGKLLEKEYNYHPIVKLSNRELQVMQYLAYGSSIKKMADTMSISEHTVKEYIRSAVKKTQAENRLHAVVILLRKGLIA